MFCVAAAAMGAVAAWLSARFPGVLEDRGGRIGLVAALAWLALILSSAAIYFRARPGKAVGAAFAWVALGAVLVLAYGYRHDVSDVVNRLAVELQPSVPMVEEGGAVSFRAGMDGHYSIIADVDGARVRFLVDTGATGVVLAPADAERLGFDLDSLAYTQPAHTANGIVMGAPVRLRNIGIGPIQVADVPATVNGAEMRESLLGMSLLNRLGGFDVRDGVLTFRP